MKISPDTTISGIQDFIQHIYGLPNDRHFGLWDMLTNVERFAMRGLKGIRKNDMEKAKLNFLISFSWFTSIMNRLHIELEAEVWKNYPYHCPYCLSCPCECKEKGYRTREFASNETQKPRTLEEFQAMYQKIYPAQNRTLDHAGVHLAEEIGEFSEAILKYRGGHNDAHFEGIKTEAADVFSNLVAVFNSLGISIAQEIAIMFSENCHICHKTPCECDYEFVVNYRS